MAENRGKGYSVRTGVLKATGTYVLFTDADLSTPIDELRKLYDIAEREPADIVIGSRAIDRRSIERHQSRFREIGGIVFNRLMRIGLGLKLHDTQCGFKLFHRVRTRSIFEKQTIDGFGFDRGDSLPGRSAPAAHPGGVRSMESRRRYQGPGDS